jgi:Arc/MetJ-type ribon-helix-helix transcriptional regulator
LKPLRPLGLSVSRAKGDVRAVSVHLPEECVEGLDELVGAGLFPSRSEALRAAVRELLKEAEAWRYAAPGGLHEFLEGLNPRRSPWPRLDGYEGRR